LLKKFSLLEFSISATTRSPRKSESHGVDYYFLSKEEFKEKINNSEFIEYEEVYSDTIYGTLKEEVNRIWDSGKTPIFDVDVAGGLKLKEYFQSQALLMFILPPSIEILKERILKRDTTIDNGELTKRLEKAAIEISRKDKFDIIIENKDLQRSCIETE